jgi:hypothetical protein
MSDKIELKGKFRVTVRDAKTDKVLRDFEVENVILSVGKEPVAQLINGEAPTIPLYCAVGSDDTAPDPAQTGLLAEIGRIEVTTRQRTGNQIVYSTFFSASDCNGTWNEMGLVNAQSGGIFLNRVLFPASIAKDSTKTVTVDYTLTVG